MKSSYLCCYACHEAYSVSIKKPLITKCCDETVCKECYRKGFSEDESQFNCPYKCLEKKRDNKYSFNVNMRLLNIILRKTPMNLNCDDHSLEDVNAFNRETNKFLCN